MDCSAPSPWPPRWRRGPWPSWPAPWAGRSEPRQPDRGLSHLRDSDGALHLVGMVLAVELVRAGVRRGRRIPGLAPFDILVDAELSHGEVVFDGVAILHHELHLLSGFQRNGRRGVRDVLGLKLDGRLGAARTASHEQGTGKEHSHNNYETGHDGVYG